MGAIHSTVTKEFICKKKMLNVLNILRKLEGGRDVFQSSSSNDAK